MSIINLDLNAREKARFAANFRELSELSAKLACEIEAGTDEDILKAFMYLSLRYFSIKEFGDILTSEMETKVKDKHKEDFPDTIFNK